MRPYLGSLGVWMGDYYTVGWAVSTYYDRQQHIQKMIQAAMAQDYSWERSARAYEAVYEWARIKAMRGR